MVYAAHNRHAVAYPTVDIALMKGMEIAPGRKRSDQEGKWRFPGGFVDPAKDETLEAAAVRELGEEMGQHPGKGTLAYVGSTMVDDWRYRNEEDGIMTSLFLVPHTHGPLTPGDDIDEAKWFQIETIHSVNLPQHRPLAEMLQTYLEKRFPKAWTT